MRVAVAYSGGRDSTALLHATLTAAEPLGAEVLALHVHHGLSPHADAWAAHCEQQCGRWHAVGLPVRFAMRRIATAPPRGDSIEAWARQARYRALREMAIAHHVDAVLLAHHRRDQAETLLLQALRGGGVAGLAGMPSTAQRDGVTWLRPWLARPREHIEAYVEHHALDFIEDDSNADARHARNRLRLRVWPALVEAFPQAEAALFDSAAWAQEALVCAQDLAALDLPALAQGDGLDVARWASLSPARRSNSLRAWLQMQTGGEAAPAALTRRLLAELPAQRPARWAFSDRELAVYRGVLRCGVPTRPTPLEPEAALSIRRAGRYALPGWRGVLCVSRVRSGGVPFAWLSHLELRRRTGGEQFQGGIGRPPRSLKKQFQDAGLPAWQRDGPLVYSGGQLVYVPGLGLDARVIAPPGPAQATLQWLASET